MSHNSNDFVKKFLGNINLEMLKMLFDTWKQERWWEGLLFTRREKEVYTKYPTAVGQFRYAPTCWRSKTMAFSECRPGPKMQLKRRKEVSFALMENVFFCGSSQSEFFVYTQMIPPYPPFRELSSAGLMHCAYSFFVNHWGAKVLYFLFFICFGPVIQ